MRQNKMIKTRAMLMAMAGLLVVGLAGRVQAGEGEPTVTVTPGVRHVWVSGDEGKFREDRWMSEDWAGGIEELTVEQILGGEWQVRVEGRAILDENDYVLRLEVVKPELLFIRAGYEEYRKYTDDAGGYYAPFFKPSYELGRDLELDIGRVYVEVGLIKPELPQVTIGYERQFKDGAKSLLEWGSVSETSLALGTDSRKIYPSVKEIDETTDIIKASVGYTVANIAMGDDFRYERYDSDTVKYDTALAVDLDALTLTERKVTIREEYDHDALFNTFHLSSHLNEKVYWSFGYLYNNVDGDGGINVMVPAPLVVGDIGASTRVTTVETDSHVLNLNLMVGPFAGCHFYGGLRGELTDTDGYTIADITQGLNPTTANEILTINNRDSIEETVGVRFVKIPWTTLYAEAGWEQATVDLFERERVNGLLGFRRQTDTDVNRQKYTLGFNTAPVRMVTVSGKYRYRVNENEYDHNVDTELGYPAFITGQDFHADELSAKVTVRPMTRLSVSLGYQLTMTDIDTTAQALPVFVPGGTVESGEYEAHVYTVSATVTPLNRLYVTGLFAYQDAETKAYANGVSAVQKYEGDVYSLIGTAGYALDEKTDITLQGSYSWADNFESNAPDGLALGMDNERIGLLVSVSRKLTQNITARLQYGYFEYTDDSVGEVDDYTAHLAAATCTVRF